MDRAGELAPPRRLRRTEFPVNTVELARYLVGRVVVHDTDDGRLSGRIVETEAYPAGDSAGHAFRGETRRNSSVFLRRGSAYGADLLDLTRGPGRLTEAMQIDVRQDGVDLCAAAPLWLDRPGKNRGHWQKYTHRSDEQCGSQIPLLRVRQSLREWSKEITWVIRRRVPT